MEAQELIYEGKAKKMYQTTAKNAILVQYLDQVTALNGVRKDQMAGKAALNNGISSIIFEWLTAHQVTSHFIRKLGETEQLVCKLEMIPLEVVVRNIAAGSFSKRFQIEQGTVLAKPIIEFYYKADELDDPFINDDHVRYFKIATDAELTMIRELALLVNEKLQELFQSIDLRLVDFKIEVGKTSEGQILLGDEISPDTCRLWDVKTNESLDKDVYRKNTGDLLTVYREIASRLTKIQEEK